MLLILLVLLITHLLGGIVMENEIKDFTSLAEGVKFKFKDVTYVVPSYSDAETMALMRKSQQIQEALGDDDRPEKPEKITSEELDRMERFFAAENSFISAGIRKVGEDGSFVEVTEEEIKPWPKKLKTEVTKLINEAMRVAQEEDVNPT